MTNSIFFYCFTWYSKVRPLAPPAEPLLNLKPSSASLHYRTQQVLKQISKHYCFLHIWNSLKILT